ncbi:MAG: aspartyl protease family protein [Planctomycetota bacterium]|nr:MAG: aspartyl protease family protein [Planctomycetota bacterium]
MLRIRGLQLHPKASLVGLFAVLILCGVAIGLERPSWRRQEVDWRMSGGSRIKAIHYPEDKPSSISTNGRRSRLMRKKTIPAKEGELTPQAEQTTIPIIANVVDSPPIAGFVPWVVLSVTDARSGELEIDAIPTTSVTGDFLPYTDPQSDYGIGIFDSGSSAHVISYVDAAQVGLYGPPYPSDYLTSNMIEISGVIGSVFTWVSQPIAVFIDGLGAIEPNGLIVDNSGMVGETNVSVLVGDPFESPNVPTVIGTPLSVYFATCFRNDRQLTITRDGNVFTSPDIRLYDSSDPCVPSYSNTIYLELRPTGGQAVQYLFDPFDPYFSPLSPSIIMVLLSGQSLFFTSRTDLAHNNKTSTQKKFMVDTGAQVSVISESQATELGIQKSNPDFWVEITGVTGETIDAKGFIIDQIEISADPEWLVFTNVPVVMLNVASPEGGTLEGIIGMNLFIEFNLVLRGGGLPDYGGHTLELEPIDYLAVADIAPGDGDGKVDNLDLAVFVEAWLATSTSSNWNPRADMAPPVRDGRVDLLDLDVLAEYWSEDVSP